jgi:hypothetical protein
MGEHKGELGCTGKTDELEIEHKKMSGRAGSRGRGSSGARQGAELELAEEFAEEGKGQGQRDELIREEERLGLEGARWLSTPWSSRERRHGGARGMGELEH